MFNFTEFIRRRWSEISPSSGQKGTVIDELAVKPSGLVLADFYNILVNQRRINDISQWATMTEQQLDIFGNKFFMPRSYGDYAFGTVRIWFDSKNEIEITADTRFVSSSGLKFKAVQPSYISGGSFLRSTDRFALYYTDVQVIAVARGNSYNIVAGDITQISGISFQYKTVTNPDPFTNGSKFENNEQYFKRLSYSINDRSMMNKRAMHAKLPEFFPIIKSMYISGSGDAYMKRDFIEAVSANTVAKRADYLGKVSGENIIKSIGFFQIYPLEAGNQNAAKWGPVSIPTAYDYPLTIEPSDYTSFEPGFTGYSLNQECTDDMYKGVYFDDFKTFMEIRTNDLFNISAEGVTFDTVLVPSPSWVYGGNGYYPGNMGILSAGVKDIEVLNFVDNTINMAGGSLNALCVGKDIKKRVGVKMAGVVKWPSVTSSPDDALNSNFQIMVGGVNGGLVDGYTGVGFGIRMTNIFDPNDATANNAIIFFAHAEAYGTTQVYLSDSDLGSGGSSFNYNIGDLTSLKESMWRMNPGEDYEFEFIFHDDLRLTLYIRRVEQSQTDIAGNEFHMVLASNMLKVFGEQLTSKDTDKYGTMMKLTLSTDSKDPSQVWTVTNLRAFDISDKRATAMFALNVDQLENPITIYARANGSGNINGLQGDGYIAYIWDKEAQSAGSGSTELTSGAWAELPALSNSDGSKDVLTNLISAKIYNVERYRVQNKFGNNIFIMFAASGTSKLKSRYIGAFENDSHSTLHVDYIKAESGLTTAYHANNKADVYLSTQSNSENIQSSITVLSKSINESFFTLNSSNSNTPISEIVSVTIGSSVNDTFILSKSDYIVSRVDSTLSASSREEYRITLVNTDSDSITVEYRAYPSISDVQKFFDGVSYGKIYGDVLVKHKFPIGLSFSIYYTGNSNNTQLSDAIKKYFDENVRSIFVVKDMVSYLYNQNLVNNIREPIQFSYTRYNDDDTISAGEFSDKIEARDIDFFRLDTITMGTL